ncbi:hypothetical protein HGRIS_000858 [Hohenbuehelia grisea]|uniref:Uncharacterized protein n=1 Tax=Hohenbuehelia grisea TaxID=104357 RepID=A0ABR3IPZ3_9AGAR
MTSNAEHDTFTPRGCDFTLAVPYNPTRPVAISLPWTRSLSFIMPADQAHEQVLDAAEESRFGARTIHGVPHASTPVIMRSDEGKLRGSTTPTAHSTIHRDRLHVAAAAVSPVDQGVSLKLPIHVAAVATRDPIDEPMLIGSPGKKQGILPAIEVSATQHAADLKQSALMNIHVKRHCRKIVKCKEYCVWYQSEGPAPIPSPLSIPPSWKPQLYNLYLHRVTHPARLQTQIWCWTKPSSNLPPSHQSQHADMGH